MSETTTELVRASGDKRLETRVGAILPQTIDEVLNIAKVLFTSGLFPDLANTGQAVAKIMAGAELGLPPIASLNAFHIVKGKIMTHYTAIAGGVRRAGYNYEVLQHSDAVCELAFFNPKGQEIGRSIFTHADAVRSGVGKDGQSGPGMLAKIPRVMLFARAMSQGARLYVPEAFNGLIVYEHSERQMIDEDVAAEGRDDPRAGTSSRVAAKIGAGAEEFNPFEEDPAPDPPFSEDAPDRFADEQPAYTGPTVRDEPGAGEQEGLPL